ncbi:MAG: PP0621 family protein [Hydrogenophilus sp.]|nr:PP0621 family protein [Hydrogenophilus sp.]
MARWLVVLVLMGGVVWWVRRWWRQRERRWAEIPRPQREGEMGEKREQLVACNYCGVLLPASEAVRNRGKTWCREHVASGGEGSGQREE